MGKLIKQKIKNVIDTNVKKGSINSKVVSTLQGALKPNLSAQDSVNLCEIMDKNYTRGDYPFHRNCGYQLNKENGDMLINGQYRFKRGSVAKEDLKYVKNISFAGDVDVVEENAFVDFENLEYVSFKFCSVERICSGAFMGLKKLRYVALPEDMTTIEEKCFYGCESLKEIVLPKDVQCIQGQAFAFSGLEKITLAEDTRFFESDAFAHTKLKKLSIINKEPIFSRDLLEECDNLKKLEIAGVEDRQLLANSKKNNKVMPLKKGEYSFDSSTGVLTINKFVSTFEKQHIPKEIAIQVKKIVLPNGLYAIGKEAFTQFTNLEELDLSQNANLTQIGESAFAGLENLRSVKLPNSLYEIKQYCFYGCNNLTDIEVPSSVQIIGKSAFSFCGIEKVTIGPNLTGVSNSAFELSSLKEVVWDREGEIQGNMFCGCDKLEKVSINKPVTIGEKVFSGCKNLTTIENTHNITEVKDYAFNGCDSLTSLDLSNAKNIYRYALNLDALQQLKMNKDVRTFFSILEMKKLLKIQDVVVPIVTIDFRRLDSYFYNASEEGYQDKIKDQDIEDLIDIAHIKTVLPDGDIVSLSDVEDQDFVGNNNNETLQLVMLKNGVLIIKNHDNGDVSKYDTNIIKKKFTDSNNLNNEVGLIRYPKVINWAKHKFLPRYYVMNVFPQKAEEIEKFYLNNNAQNWSKLMAKFMLKYQYDGVYSTSNKETLVEIAYVLGVFSENGKESQVATEYILNELLEKHDIEVLHKLFSGVDLNAGYDAEFAKLFMYNFSRDEKCFETHLVEENQDVNMLAQVFNNFKKVKEMYPSKKAITRHNNERLTPQMAIDAVSKVQYQEVDERALELAEVVGKYGYTQEEYKELEEWYLKGLEIDKEDMVIKLDKDKYLDAYNAVYAINEKDDEDLEKGQNSAENGKISPKNAEKLQSGEDIGDIVTYEMLDKSNPLGAVVGNITNCCQRCNGAGSGCVEYGMTKPNSSFIVFRNKGAILGQAWVWYDEKNKQVTLDNIEVPDSKLNIVEKDKKVQKQFVKTLLRLRDGFVKEMGEDKVKTVTIGTGYNNINHVLNKNFELVEGKLLSDYDDYTDARKGQYDLFMIKKNEQDIFIAGDGDREF